MTTFVIFLVNCCLQLRGKTIAHIWLGKETTSFMYSTRMDESHDTSFNFSRKYLFECGIKRYFWLISIPLEIIIFIFKTFQIQFCTCMYYTSHKQDSRHIPTTSDNKITHLTRITIIQQTTSHRIASTTSQLTTTEFLQRWTIVIKNRSWHKKYLRRIKWKKTKTKIKIVKNHVTFIVDVCDKRIKNLNNFCVSGKNYTRK